MLGLVVRVAHLENGGAAAGGAHGHDQRALPVPRRPVVGQLPLRHEVADQPGQSREVRREALTPLGVRREGRRDRERQGHRAILPGRESLARRARFPGCWSR